MKRKSVYIAGPYTSPDPLANTQAAISFWHALHEAGFLPFCPHVGYMIDQQKPLTYEQWMEYDLAWLEKCDALLRIPGVSPGADHEVHWAKKLGIPVFHSLAELREHFAQLVFTHEDDR